MNVDGSIIIDGPHIQLLVLYKEPSGNPLTYIQNPTPGQQITISIVNTANTLTVEGGGSGNILLVGGTCLLDSALDTILLIYKTGVNMWLEQTRQITATE